MAEEPFPSTVSTPEPARRQRLDSTPTRTPSTPSANRHDHPYLIRTTSSSLLTRSNSIGSVHKPPLHVSVTPNSPALGRSQGRGHKHTKSQSSAPVPLPLPPQSPLQPEKAPLSAASPSPDVKQAFTTSEGVGRLRRSDTLPSVHSSSPARSIKVEDLPTNPKAWTSTHLARYLSSALRVKGGGTLPAPVVRDIATFVVNQKLSGRAFLRLTQQDLEVMGMNQLWRPALLDASRILRQNVVQGRIWGFGNIAEDIPPSPSSTRTSPTNGTTSTVTKATHMPSVPSTVFEDYSDDGREAMSGPEDRYEGGNGWIARGMLTRSASSLAASTSSIGRVRDMVATFERSASGSSASENDSNSANEISPFDFGSSNEVEQETILSPVHEEAILFSMQDRRPLQDDMEAGADEAGFASGELTSGSEAGDEDEEDDGFGGDKVKTASDKTDDPQAGRSELEEEEIPVPGKDEDSSKESDSSPTSSSSPLTPPPVYETQPVGLVTPSEAELTLHEDETSDGLDLLSPKRHSRSPSSTLMLTSSQRRNPSFVAQICPDSGSDDTIENLIADFTASELEQHPMVASWGANAWLDDNVKEGATAKKIHEPVYHSLSRRSGKAFRSQESSAGSGSSKLMSLFEDPALDKKTVDVSVDASQPEETEESRKIKELQEHQVQQQALLDQFRERLEEVERRLEEMEAKEAEREERERTIEAAASAKTRPVVASDEAGEIVLANQEGHVQECHSNDTGKEIVERGSNEWCDPTLGGLPSYVFLVGLGVAAICMRVVVKRVAGKKGPGMLGFL